MRAGAFLSPAAIPVLVTLALIIAGTVLLARLARRGFRPRLWTDILGQPARWLAFTFLALSLVGTAAIFARVTELERAARQQARMFATQSNLIYGSPFARVALTETAAVPLATGIDEPLLSPTDTAPVGSQRKLVSRTVPVRPGDALRWSFQAGRGGTAAGHVQARLLWLSPVLSDTGWVDSEEWVVLGGGPLGRPLDFRMGTAAAPAGAAFARLEVRDLGSGDESPVLVAAPTLVSTGPHVEPHPNGALASLALSFDWETAMGGAIHSKGMEQHDSKAAEAHGIQMREGADWLAALFDRHDVAATFYATGYNLLEDNRERRTFSGDPIYAWAREKWGWRTDYWTTHPWFRDDPFGDFRSHPAWYFGDQTALLSAAGHEIAPHTFGHLYVRGASPEELAVDMDEWLRAARGLDLPAPTSFAFPWRSSNSLTPAFYDALYTRGIRVVTRIYERDMRDLFTLGALPAYPQMQVMPDFLLGAPEGGEIEEADGGQTIPRGEGLRVVRDLITRRGTTSFWNHPEQLAPEPTFAKVREAWEAVVAEAAGQRDSGTLWIAPVGEIAAYQRDVSQVSARLERGLFGRWDLVLQNDSGKELAGVTITLPTEAESAGAGSNVQFVFERREGAEQRVDLVTPDSAASSRLVLGKLAPGNTRLEIDWLREPPE